MRVPGLLVPLLTCLLALPAGLAACGGDQVGRFVTEGGLEVPGTAGFAVERRFSFPGAAASEQLEARRGAEVLRIKVDRDLPAARAAALVAGEWTQLKSVFEPARPPYPEFLTNQSACPKEYMPVEHDHAAGRYALMYAGGRLGYGVCNPDQVRFSAGVGIYQCPGRGRVVKVEYFVPGRDGRARVEALLRGARCR